MADERVRLWTTILYPKDLKKRFDIDPRNEGYEFDLIKLISSLNIPAVLSPLHCPDPENINPEEQRKKHYHLMLSFEGKKSEAQVSTYLGSIFPDHCGWVRPIQVASAKALVRYFIHLDQPEKQQFKGKWETITTFGGFKLDDYLEPSSSEKYKYVLEMQHYCIEHKIYEISDLMEVCSQIAPDTWGYVLNMCCTLTMKHFLDSRRYKHEKEIKDLRKT